MKPSILALATLVACAGAAQAQTESNVVSPETTLARAGQLPSTSTSSVIVLEERQVAAVEAACGCYPNNCGG